MAHSDEWADAGSAVSFVVIGLPINRLWVATLGVCQLANASENSRCHVLEGIQCFLPTPVAFHSDLDTAENHLLPAAEVDTQLYNVAIFDRKGSGLDAWLTESDVVQKGAGGAFDVFNVPLAIGAPEFAVFPANDLGLEAYGSSRWDVGRRVWSSVTLRVSSDSDDGVLRWKCSRHGRKDQGGPIRARVLVWHQTYRGQLVWRTVLIQPFAHGC